MVVAQGGDPQAPRPLADASDLRATEQGSIATIETEQLGLAMIELGGGRRQMNDPIDHGVGLELLVRLGDTVKEGQLLGRLFAREAQREAVSELVLNAIHIEEQDVQPVPLILNHIGPTTGS